MRRGLLLLLLLSACAPKRPTGPRGARWSLAAEGGVSRGAAYSTRLQHGLFFRLAPTRTGWEIEVTTSAAGGADLSSVATPPYRGVNDRRIDVASFSSAEAGGAGGVNAPSTIRTFRFVGDLKTRNAARAALRIALWPEEGGGEGRQAALQQLHDLLEGAMRGRLTITGLEPAPPKKNPEAAIRRMRFRLETSPY